MDKNTINTAYDELLARMMERFEAGERLATTRARVDTARLDALRDGLITGKNEDERKANARIFLADLYKELAEAEEVDRLANYRLAHAQTEVERTQALLRLSETQVRWQEIHENYRFSK